MGCRVFFIYIVFLCSGLHAEKNFTVTTIPKTGTHFIDKFLERLTGKKAVFANQRDLDAPYFYVRSEKKFKKMVQNPKSLLIHWYCSPIPVLKVSQKLDEFADNNLFLSAHAPYSRQFEKLLKQKDYVNFFVVRDPRDYAVSLANHFKRFGSDMFPDELRALSFEELLIYVILGTDWYNETRHIFDVFLQWRHSSNTCCLQFEKLVGSGKGNCTPEEHLQELRKVADALEMEIEDERLLAAFDEAFGKGYTYTSSKTGNWSEKFNPEHKELFKECMGSALIELGYELSLDW